MTKWIRPKGCEGGACVEYRVVDGKVFVRSPASPDTRMIVFTVAEWDTFVAGLTAPIAAELAGAHTIAQRANARAEELAGAVGRLETELAEMDRWNQAKQAELAKMRQTSSWPYWRARVDRIETERNKAVAEAAVLRHRDRRTQAVVDAAVALHAGFAARKPGGGSAELCGLTAAVDALLQAKLCICRPRHREDDPICQYVPEAPETGLSATESPDQPPVEDTATDGLEAQGGAQPVYTPRVWHHSTCGRTVTGPARLECDCGTDGEWVTYSNSAGVPLPTKPGSFLKVHWGEPRVWNAGDPEPEGVERVRGRHFLWRLTDRGWYDVNRHGEDVDGNHGVSWATWSWVLNDAPLTEVLPEPAAPTAADLQAARDQTRAAAKTMLTVTEPGIKVLVPDLSLGAALSRAGKAREVVPTFEDDGEVREAGRAGEAQEARLYSADLDPDASKNSSDVRPQDRTEGLAAAIEAGLVGWDARVQQGSLARHTGDARREVVKAVLRAASPLIERAALQAAEDALGEEVDNAIEPSDREALMHACDVVRRLRATRTETS